MVPPPQPQVIDPEPVMVTPRPRTEPATADEPAKTKTSRLLYVASPGIRNELAYGGHGLLVFDINLSDAH